VKKFCSYILESVLKSSKLLTNDIADSADRDVMRCVFCEDCKVCDENDKDNEDNEDNKDNEEDSEDTDCEESS